MRLLVGRTRQLLLVVPLVMVVTMGMRMLLSWRWPAVLVAVGGRMEVLRRHRRSLLLLVLLLLVGLPLAVVVILVALLLLLRLLLLLPLGRIVVVAPVVVHQFLL